MAAAMLFAALTILYSAAWMYYVRRPQSQVEIGIDDSSPPPRWSRLTNVHKNSPAEKAGLKTNDLIVAINGKRASFGSGVDRIVDIARG